MNPLLALNEPTYETVPTTPERILLLHILLRAVRDLQHEDRAIRTAAIVWFNTWENYMPHGLGISYKDVREHVESSPLAACLHSKSHEDTPMLVLKRMPEYAGATPGHIFFDGEWVRASLELPWRYNGKNVSCIPCGTYRLAYTHSHKFKMKTLELLDVPGREHIRIHPFNRVEESEGCIAAVTDLIIEPGSVTGRSSAMAVAALERLVLGQCIETIRVEDVA